jgi:opacity protein-like surface antigen
MSRLWMFVAVGALLVVATARPAPAADLPGDSYLRGSLPSEPSQWDGFYVGGHFGYSNLHSDASGTNSTRDSFGGFIGYNTQQWDPQLVLGFELGYNRPSSLETPSTSTAGGSSYKLVDYVTFRGRAGYAVGQFLPYAVLGAAVGRVNYSTTTTGGSNQSQDNVFPFGFVAGLGMDVLLLPNVFLRGEWEGVLFTHVGGIRSNVNTGRVALGVRF